MDPQERIAELEAEIALLKHELKVERASVRLFMELSTSWSNQVCELRRKHNDPWPIIEGL